MRRKNQKLLDLNSVFHYVVITRKDSKKDSLVRYDSRHLLLINVEDPCQYTYLRNLKKNPDWSGNYVGKCCYVGGVW
jgi:hypothetical protein